MVWRMSTDEEFPLVELDNGTLFPAKVEVFGRYADGPLLELTLGTKNGRPTVFDLKITPDSEDGSGVTGSMVREIPVATSSIR